MKPQTRKNPGKVRIIAGHWRGSRLDVPDVEGLRPSSDRVRETLFNWLQGHIAGARCLDMFAGSGALGFEAASRGAAQVLMIERDAKALATLRATQARLGGQGLEIIAADALAWLAQKPDRRFDVVFIDPPFAADLQQKACAAVVPWLAEQALVYVETAREAALPQLPGFSLRREGGTREVRFALFHRQNGNDGGGECGLPVTLPSPFGAEPIPTP